MPEGDSIYRVALALRPVLVGRELVEVRHREVGPIEALAGARGGSIETRGKHLLVHLGGGWTWRAHLGMYGDVHLYRSDERWRRSTASAVLTLRTSDQVVVWFEPARAELLRSADLAAHPILSKLGPDLLAPEIDLDEVLRRARARDQLRDVAELLLDQTVACGIGNIFKSETLFVERVDPWTAVRDVSGEAIVGLYRSARELLRSSVARGPRSTGREGVPRFWVYGREHRRCLRCGAQVRVALQGDGARGTYSCPGCQV